MFKASIVNRNSIACVHAKSPQLCWTLCNPLDCSHQAPLSMGFSRQEYWSGLPFPPAGDLPNAGIKLVSLMSPALAGGFFTTRTNKVPYLWVRSWVNWKFVMDREAWRTAVHGVTKSQTRLSD